MFVSLSIEVKVYSCVYVCIKNGMFHNNNECVQQGCCTMSCHKGVNDAETH